jgi:tetratricopeptide (TPR) repeat protein
MRMATTNNRVDNESLLYTLTGEVGRAAARRPLSAQFIADLIKPITRTEQLISLADRLVEVAESALDLHQTAAIEHVSQVLRQMPLPRRYESLAEFYRTFALRRRGALAESCAGFEQLAETSTLPLAFRARSLQAMALSRTEQGRWDDALYGFLQAARAAMASGDLLGQVTARWMMAVHFQSRHGDHAGALKVYEDLMPFVRVLASEHPYAYYSMLNSRALELIELGRGDEALHLSSIAVRSPVANVHPEYLETQTEILEKMRRASPSVVGVRWPQEPVEAAAPLVAASNVITLPLNARAVAPPVDAASQPMARVISYRGWQQPANDSADIAQESFTAGELRQMSIHDKQKALLTVIFNDDISHDTLDRLLACAGKIITDQTVG